MRSNAFYERMGNEATRQKMELKFRKVLQSEVIYTFVYADYVSTSMQHARHKFSLLARMGGAYVVSEHSRNARKRVRWYLVLIFSHFVRAPSASHAHCLSCFVLFR